VSLIWHNGALHDEHQPIFTVHDRLNRGDGVFDTLLAILEPQHAPRLVRAEAHFTRLLGGAGLLQIGPLPSAVELHAAALELLAASDVAPGRSAVNTVISRGPGVRGLSPPPEQHPHVVIYFSSVPAAFPPLTAIVSRSVRRNEGSPLSRIKSINYGDNILATIEARTAGADEAILLNNRGTVACGTVGNLFIAAAGDLLTPPLSDGTMAGTLRQLLLEEYGAREATLTVDDLHTADGVFITNSIRGVVPVVRLDGSPLNRCSLTLPPDLHER
jgi:branched-chain amino acid aminotransferase